jgi:hypothetical protein
MIRHVHTLSLAGGRKYANCTYLQHLHREKPNSAFNSSLRTSGKIRLTPACSIKHRHRFKEPNKTAGNRISVPRAG